jgi:hypothetical protein
VALAIRRVRKTAWEIWRGEDRYFPVMLRTYYDGSDGGEGNRRFREYTEVSDWCLDVAHCLALNDRELFNFGPSAFRHRYRDRGLYSTI